MRFNQKEEGCLCGSTRNKKVVYVVQPEIRRLSMRFNQKEKGCVYSVQPEIRRLSMWFNQKEEDCLCGSTRKKKAVYSVQP